MPSPSSLLARLTAALLSLAASPALAELAGPLTVQDQGSFAVGGTMLTAPGTFDPRKPLDPAGQTFHGDHVYAFYQVPPNARKYPIVMWHGAGQFSKSWETTADGREGFQTIFLRRRFSTYLIDQPRRGNAGRSTVEATVKPTPDEQLWYNQFRIGLWPNCFPGSQFPCGDAAALDQFFRSITPNTGPYDPAVLSDGVAALFAKVGPGILFTHSQGGGPGWLTVTKSRPACPIPRAAADGRRQPQAGGADGQRPVRRRVGAAGPVQARPQPDHRRDPDRAEPPGPAALAHGAGVEERRDAGGADRDRHPFLADGRLQRMLDDWCPPFPGYHLYHPSRRHSPALSLLVDVLRYHGS